MLIIVISDSESEDKDREGIDDNETLAPLTSQPMPQTLGLFDGLVRGIRSSERACRKEERVQHRARHVMDDDENNAYGLHF
jgi:hypothetical protein